MRVTRRKAFLAALVVVSPFAGSGATMLVIEWVSALSGLAVTPDFLFFFGALGAAWATLAAALYAASDWDTIR